jgi:hypothetical protein
MRLVTCCGLIGVMFTVAVYAAPPSTPKKAAPANPIDRAVAKVFKAADRNRDGSVSPEELEAVDKLIDSTLDQLKKGNVIGGPKPIKGPDADEIVDNEAMTQEEFHDYFVSRAAELDAQIRAPLVEPVAPPPAVFGNRDRDRDEERRLDRERDRLERDRRNFDRQRQYDRARRYADPVRQVDRPTRPAPAPQPVVKTTNKGRPDRDKDKKK